MRRNELTGTGNVFRFTLAQYLKSASTIVTMLVMVVAVIASVFIAGYSMDEGEQIAGNIRTINIVNRTGVPVSAGDIAACDMSFAGLAEAAPDKADAVLTIELAEDSYTISAAGEDVDEYAAMRLEGAALTAFEMARAGVQPYSSRAMTMEEYLGGVQDNEDDFAASFTVTYVYSILVLVLVMLSSSYIIRSVLEEKASRLVEMLMVSVKPLALIIGKILASMCLVVIQLVLMAAGGFAAIRLVGYFGGNTDMAQMVAATGALNILEGLDAFTVFAAFVSIMLGFMTFALIGGLSASCCDSMDDMNTASTATVFSALAGYLAATAASGLGSTGATVFSLVPFVSVFVAPVKYLEGYIGIGVLVAAWALQLGVIVLLAVLCRRTYAALIMHTGGRIKLKGLMRMAGIGGGKA